MLGCSFIWLQFYDSYLMQARNILQYSITQSEELSLSTVYVIISVVLLLMTYTGGANFPCHACVYCAPSVSTVKLSI